MMMASNLIWLTEQRVGPERLTVLVNAAHTAPWSNIGVEEELVDHPAPRLVLVEVVVVLGGDLAQLQAQYSKRVGSCKADKA